MMNKFLKTYYKIDLILRRNIKYIYIDIWNLIIKKNKNSINIFILQIKN